MSSDKYAKALAREQATAEVLKTFIPQLFSSPKDISEGAPDVGDQDRWMLSNIPPETALGLMGLRLVAEAEHDEFIKGFVVNTLSTLKGINAFTSKQGERIAIGMSAGVGKKVVKRPGWMGRNVTNRNYRERAESEGTEIEE